MFADPSFSVRSLGPLIKLEKEIVKEGLDSGPLFAALLSIISKPAANPMFMRPGLALHITVHLFRMFPRSD